MANVLIERDTMTAIADSLRARHGETKIVTKTETIVKISKTSNVTDKDTFSYGYGDSKAIFDVVTIPGATALEVELTYQTESTSYDWVQIAKGELSSSSSFTGTKYGGSTKTTKTLTYPGTDTITFYFKSDNSSSNYFGYYAEVRGYDANGDYVLGEVEEEVANTYKPAEMPGAIDDILTPTGEIEITMNGSHDVADYATAVVNVGNVNWSQPMPPDGGWNFTNSPWSASWYNQYSYDDNKQYWTFDVNNVNTITITVQYIAFSGNTSYNATIYTKGFYGYSAELTSMGDSSSNMDFNYTLTEVDSSVKTDSSKTTLFTRYYKNQSTTVTFDVADYTSFTLILQADGYSNSYRAYTSIYVSDIQYS